MHIAALNPASPQASNIVLLWNACLWVCGFILAVVTGSILYIMFRFRRRDGLEPYQRTGNRTLEITWTAVPLALVTFLFVFSILTARAVDRPITRDPDVVVIGHQWWWEVRYPAANAITANEIHLPVGRDILLAIESADVIHDFWAPRLGRKIDAIPGLRNFVWIRAETPAPYRGACAEYCGAQHAWMRFRVVGEDEAAYDAWLAAQAAPATPPSTPEAQLGLTRFRQLTCANCHDIRGVNKQKQYGPDLTHVASRQMLAGERLENTSANLRDWLHEPNVVKPNCLMPNLNLSDQDLDALAAYLGGLH
jgi:cytochrome c oxidase subunit II